MVIEENFVMRLTHILVPFTALVAAHVVVGCSDAVDTNDCHTYSTCPGGGAATAGTAGNTSEAGAETGGSSSGKAGMGGVSGKAGSASGGPSASGAGAGGDGGAGGTPIMLPCDGACAGTKPVCKESTDTCVQCLAPSDCVTATAMKCDTGKNTCVECLASTDCLGATAAKCDAGTCVKCTTNDDCAHVAGKTVCDAAAGECVQCTGADYASCGMSGGKPLICDSKARTCTNNKEHSADRCIPCVSDAQCALGQLCVKEQFGAPKQDVGNFCFWQQGAPAGGAPADCTLPANIPYVAALKNQTSVDGKMATICGLRSSTCIARNQFSSKDCATSNAGDDQKCGFAPSNDSKCLPFGASQFRCSMACVSGDDCAGGLGCGADSFCKLEP